MLAPSPLDKLVTAVSTNSAVTCIVVLPLVAFKVELNGLPTVNLICPAELVQIRPEQLVASPAVAEGAPKVAFKLPSFLIVKVNTTLSPGCLSVALTLAC